MNPTELSRFIALVVDEEIDIEIVKCWYRCVRDKGPYGVTSTLQSTEDNGGLRSAVLIHRQAGEKHYYAVPLSRDLMEREAEAIVKAFTEEHPDFDCDIEATIIPTRGNKSEEPKIDVDRDDYVALCTEFAKRQHEDWVRERTAEGWRYGEEADPKERTHPLLRPWDQLPDRAKNVDLKQPQKLLDLLNANGYAVVQKSDLEAVLRLVRSLKS